MYSIQNYQKEIEDLSAASDQGWQLVKGGFFGILAAVLAILAFSGPTLPKILLFLLYVILSVLRLWRWYIQKKPNSEGDPLAALQREVLYFRVLFSSL